MSLERIYKFIKSNKILETEYILIKQQSVENYSIFK
jgi:hypothetical protein